MQENLEQIIASIRTPNLSSMEGRQALRAAVAATRSDLFATVGNRNGTGTRGEVRNRLNSRRTYTYPETVLFANARAIVLELIDKIESDSVIIADHAKSHEDDNAMIISMTEKIEALTNLCSEKDRQIAELAAKIKSIEDAFKGATPEATQETPAP